MMVIGLVCVLVACGVLLAWIAYEIRWEGRLTRTRIDEVLFSIQQSNRRGDQRYTVLLSKAELTLAAAENAKRPAPFTPQPTTRREPSSVTLPDDPIHTRPTAVPGAQAISSLALEPADSKRPTLRPPPGEPPPEEPTTVFTKPSLVDLHAAPPTPRSRGVPEGRPLRRRESQGGTAA